MPRLELRYLEDGEWLSVSTNPERGGSAISMEPESHDVIAATDPSKGMARMIRPTGHFKIDAPYDNRLKDWGLQLNDIPRMYDNLRFDAITALFGEEVTEQVQLYHRTYNERRESVGDLIAKFMRRGPMRLSEGFDMTKSRIIEIHRDLNAVTQEARAALLEQAIEDSGRLVIARSVLIAD